MIEAIETKDNKCFEHRSCSAEETWQFIQPKFNHFGITRVANVTGLDSLGLPVCVAIRPNSKGLSTSQGKGLSLIQAKVSAAMESIESWHGENIDTPLFHGSYKQAKANNLPVAQIHGFAHRPTNLSLANTQTLFVQATRLSNNSPSWIPFDCVSTDFTFDMAVSPVFMRSSNGLAAGNTFTEACCQGIYELIERDAVQRWMMQGGLERPALKLHKSLVPELDDVLLNIKLQQNEILIWDLSEFSAIPCYAALLIRDPKQKLQRNVGLFSGYGCHLSPKYALTRAVLEAIQSRLTLITGSRDDMMYDEYLHCRDDDFTNKIWQCHEGALPAQINHEDQSKAELSSDLNTLTSKAEQYYRQPLYCFDLSKKNIAIPVVKMVMPGINTLGTENHYYLQAKGTQL